MMPFTEEHDVRTYRKAAGWVQTMVPADCLWDSYQKRGPKAQGKDTTLCTRMGWPGHCATSGVMFSGGCTEQLCTVTALRDTQGNSNPTANTEDYLKLNKKAVMVPDCH